MSESKDCFDDIVETIECSSAEEFVNVLRTSNEYFAGETSCHFVFRGHNDASYDLIPSLFRPDVDSSYAYCRLRDLSHNRLEASGKSFIDISNTEGERKHSPSILVNVENRLLVNFALRANSIGLHVPELEKALTDDGHIDYQLLDLNRLNFLISIKKLDQTRPPLFAGLAQHHGVKTRLLDFTYNPQKAIFFAIHGIKDFRSDRDEICVWAIPIQLFDDRLFYSMGEVREQGNGSSPFARYSKMLMATSVNDFLYRQEGLFLYPVYPHEYYSKFEKYPSVLDYLRYIKPSVESGFRVFKITASKRLYEPIARLLRMEGITLASLMPTFNHIVEEMNSYY